MANRSDTWPDGKTWVFQGTVAEDATAGTHVTSLTVTPGAGNEFKILYGSFIFGASATSETPRAFIDDGTNIIVSLFNANGAQSFTATGVEFDLPQNPSTTGATNLAGIVGGSELVVSGTMRLKLQFSTTAVSITNTFSVACRVKGNVPTATLADTVGAPVLTTNTNRTF